MSGLFNLITGGGGVKCLLLCFENWRLQQICSSSGGFFTWSMETKWWLSMLSFDSWDRKQNLNQTTWGLWFVQNVKPDQKYAPGLQPVSGLHNQLPE